MAVRSLYITRAGYNNLQGELNHIWIKRREVTAALADAAAEGDRSENAEYIYRKKELRGIDRRIRYLQKRIPELNVVDEQPSNTNTVYFAAWVTLEDPEGRETTYRIVGSDEFDPGNNWISVDSPMAKALIGKAMDEEILVETPKGKQRFTVIAILYK
ncbi:MAG: transcription elongation factor GreB [Gammaproteobacteria bacterium]